METKLRTRHDIFHYKITSHLIEKGSRLRPALTHRGANFSHSNFQLNFNFDQPFPSPCVLQKRPSTICFSVCSEEDTAKGGVGAANWADISEAASARYIWMEMLALRDLLRFLFWQRITTSSNIKHRTSAYRSSEVAMARRPCLP